MTSNVCNFSEFWLQSNSQHFFCQQCWNLTVIKTHKFILFSFFSFNWFYWFLSEFWSFWQINQTNQIQWHENLAVFLNFDHSQTHNAFSVKNADIWSQTKIVDSLSLSLLSQFFFLFFSEDLTLSYQSNTRVSQAKHFRIKQRTKQKRRKNRKISDQMLCIKINCKVIKTFFICQFWKFF